LQYHQPLAISGAGFKEKENNMWYFAWILGIGLALAFGIINVMWLEANYAFGRRTEESTKERFESARAAEKSRKKK
jgi:cytochrome bd-I ubiquinol oxidase subunit X